MCEPPSRSVTWEEPWPLDRIQQAVDGASYGAVALRQARHSAPLHVDPHIIRNQPLRVHMARPLRVRHWGCCRRHAASAAASTANTSSRRAAGGVSRRSDARNTGSSSWCGGGKRRYMCVHPRQLLGCFEGLAPPCTETVYAVHKQSRCEHLRVHQGQVTHSPKVLSCEVMQEDGICRPKH